MVLFDLLQLAGVFLYYLRIEYLWHALIMPLTNRNGITAEPRRPSDALAATSRPRLSRNDDQSLQPLATLDGRSDGSSEGGRYAGIYCCRVAATELRPRSRSPVIRLIYPDRAV